MLSLLNNICGQPFAEYISACFHRADMFSLTKNGWKGAAESKEHSCLLQRLSQYHIQTIHTNHWFCFRVPEGYKLEVYLFTADAESKKIILEEYNRIFHGNVLWNQPEDLCFFEKGKLFAGSVSHENICYVYGRGDEWEDKIKQHGLWEEIPDALEEQIQI